jgi:hypothetical protein
MAVNLATTTSPINQIEGAAGNLNWLETILAGDQGASTVTAPGGGGNLSGSTYLGQGGNLISGIPGVGGIASGLLSGFFGSKPSVPDPTATANQAIVGDISNLGNLGQLAEGTSEISAESAAIPYEMNLPGYDANLNQAATNTAQELSGQLPQDVQNQIQEAAAERGIATGQGAGSPNANAALLQDLGLTSLQEQQMGQQNLSQLIGETPTGQTYNTQSMEVTPEAEQAAQLLSNEIAASPDPILSGLMNMFGGALGGGGIGGLF